MQNSARPLSASPYGFYHENPVRSCPALTHCGDALCSIGHEVAPHQHRGFEFLCLARGELVWQVKKRTFTHQTGAVFVARPGEMHFSAAASLVETHQLWVGLDLERAGGGGRKLAQYLSSGKVRFFPSSPAFESLIRAIVQQVVVSLPRQSSVVRALVSAMIELIEQAVVLREEPSAAPILPYSYGIQKVLAYLDGNLHRRVSLRELAAVAAMRQPSHFCSHFHREVGEAPASYHLRRRLDEAKAVLLEPGSVVTEVALRYGFASSQHFSTAFRQQFGFSPRTWQRKCRSRALAHHDGHPR